ncbi:uncharacterized protein LOC106643182 [Copidosoma floridanum]|uniref:uncharacterized protein LOC106643182 n=1 Tax=Copidosoma floridanum TaxID=29053 RepID=UPI0006C9E1F7|nr:uncharacterized protein LOC106643182 [Copidosoma floridanum]
MERNGATILLNQCILEGMIREAVLTTAAKNPSSFEIDCADTALPVVKVRDTREEVEIQLLKIGDGSFHHLQDNVGSVVIYLRETKVFRPESTPGIISKLEAVLPALDTEEVPKQVIIPILSQDIHTCVMNVEGVKEPFYKRHQYLFTGVSIKFEGFQSDIKERLKDIVTKCNGHVGDDGRIILVTKDFFLKSENNKREDLYDIRFISTAIDDKKIPEIEKFRFTPIISTDPCCWVAENVLKCDSCVNYYHTHVRCIQCTKDASSPTEMILENDKENDLSPKKTKRKKPKNQESSSIEQLDKIIRKRLYVDDSDSDIEVVEVKKKKKKTKRPSNEDTEENSFVYQKSAQKTVKKIFNSFQGLKWWEKLPPPENIIMTEETGVPRSGGGFFKGPRYSDQEMRLMITFLVQNNLIHRGYSRTTWKMFNNAGYLKHRTIESLRNNFMRSILPKISCFGLPREFEVEFDKVIGLH